MPSCATRSVHSVLLQPSFDMAHCGLLLQTTFVSGQGTRLSSRTPTPLHHSSCFRAAVRGPNTVVKHKRTQALTVQAAATAEVGKLIAKTEIPAFIPRQDLMDQLTRWAYTDIQEEGMRKFGLPCKVNTCGINMKLC